MNRRKATIAALFICGITALAPATASARTAYFTGSTTSELGSYAAPIELTSGVLGGLTGIGSEGAPPDVAITPDGSTAYVTGAFDELVGIDVATATEARSVSMSGNPWAVAISPDGKHAYTANRFEDSVSVLDLTSLTEVATIPVSGSPDGIAISPDGTRAYVSAQSEGKVLVINLATDAVVNSITVGGAPRGIAVTPDGKQLVVVDRIGHKVVLVDTATETVTATIPTGVSSGEEDWVAITPDGTRAYVIGRIEFPASPEAWVTPIDLAAGTAGGPVTFQGRAGDVAILPAGNRAYITHFEERFAGPAAVQTRAAQQGSVSDLLPLNLGTNALEAGLETYEFPEALAIVPNQGPHAAIEGPASGSTGADLSFDGSKSSDSDGTVARYDWSFGDGTGAANAGPAVSHAYASPGTYQVTLTTTDNEGCSTEEVFTGQTAYCNGSALARATHQVVVAGAAPKPKTLARCKQVSGKATSFTPRIRPGHVVPGVRVRLAVPTPSRLDVKARLLWSVAGNQGSAQLESLSVNVNHWRRLRFPIPDQLGSLLPLGTAVTLELTIKTTPHKGAACAATVVQKTLHVRVVKVFPNAVQSKRPR
jgi:YVTN family beta-propeller protein